MTHFIFLTRALRYLLILGAIGYVAWLIYAPAQIPSQSTPLVAKALLTAATPFYTVPSNAQFEPYLHHPLRKPLIEVIPKTPPPAKTPPVAPKISKPIVTKPNLILQGTIQEDQEYWAILSTSSGQAEIVSPGKSITLIPGDFILRSVNEREAVIYKKEDATTEFTIPLAEKK